jgi:glycogen debranching enzyme
MAGETISILRGDTFVVSDRRGDVDASPSEPEGLFHQDTRFLSHWQLTVDGQLPNVLSIDDSSYFSTQFFLAPGTGTVYVDAPFSIVRRRVVTAGFDEELTVINHAAEPLELELRLEAAADFADLFEVKDALAKKGEHYAQVAGDRVVLGYRRAGFCRETWISADAPETELREDGLRFRLRVEPHGRWTARVEVRAAVHAFSEVGRVTHPAPPSKRELDEWIAAAPRLRSNWRSLELTYEQSLTDLAALRFYPHILPSAALPAAGLPWFMTIFGRDSLITSYQTLPFTPELAENTLRVLVLAQGHRLNDFRDEEPGKILHELRLGELTAFEERPHAPYFGTADATPLFLIVLDEMERWTGNAALVRELEGPARAALAWIDEYGDRDGDGFVEYERRNTESGLENQCWKDSWDSIRFADGTLAKGPIATCEIQGYVYDAKLRCARLAREFWGDPELADRLEAEAEELQRRFDEAFWVEERGCYALALDGEKHRVDSLTSNIGHLLWSRIVPAHRAERIVSLLMGPELFSGWGVRTMAEGEGGYNPISYHCGTVWPHDNSLIAAGLARYGYRKEAARIAHAVLEAAAFFRHRLPEVFAGYARSETGFPVEYPTACSPQAWASGSSLLFVRTFLALEPDGTRSPSFPAEIRGIELEWADRPQRPAAETVVASAGPANGSANGSGPKPAAFARDAREFFGRLAEFVDLSPMNGDRLTYRFDVVDVGSWHVTIDAGMLTVAESDAPADCVFRGSEEVLMRMARGEQNPTTAFLTGLVQIEGDLLAASKFRVKP